MSDRLHGPAVLCFTMFAIGTIGGATAMSLAHRPTESDTMPSVDRVMICYAGERVMLRAVSGMGSDEWIEIRSGAPVLSVTGSCVIYEDIR